MHKLALKGEARIAPAIASPDRARSHFEAQDVLENGATAAYGTIRLAEPRAAGDGARQGQGDLGRRTAPLILRGGDRGGVVVAGAWHGRDPRLPGILQDLYANDPMLSRALASGLATEAMAKVANADATAALIARRRHVERGGRPAPSAGERASARAWPPMRRRRAGDGARACPPPASWARRWPAS